MPEKPEISRRPKPSILFEENIEQFNRLVAEGKPPDLRTTNLAGLDLRKAHLRGLNLSGSYMRGTNLAGLDLTDCNLSGASLRGAHISGTLFPIGICAEEIRLSVEYGTRIRIR
ncbi:MAG: pentapeptide repeat-containing protein [Deltaproteobacteria bacterium]|nr:pentapeptide repeat-containing protein [Deltaproteobacteria bacterium]